MAVVQEEIVKMDPIGQTLEIFEVLAYALAPGISEVGVAWYVFWFVFFLSYVLIFSLLNYIHFLKDNANAKIIVSLVMAFIIASNGWALAIIAATFPSLGVLLAVGLGILILMALFLPNQLEKNLKLFGYLTLIFVAIFIISTAYASGVILSSDGFGDVGYFLEAYLGVIIVVAVFVGVIMFMKGGESKGGSKKGKATLLEKLLSEMK